MKIVISYLQINRYENLNTKNFILSNQYYKHFKENILINF